VICIGRQFGKTMMATNQMMYWALNNPRSKIAWVSPVYKQAKKVFADTYKAFIKRPEIYKNINKGDLIVEYRNGSTIQFFSSERLRQHSWLHL
jgi:phage terminase large subunit-like protein